MIDRNRPTESCVTLRYAHERQRQTGRKVASNSAFENGSRTVFARVRHTRTPAESRAESRKYSHVRRFVSEVAFLAPKNHKHRKWLLFTELSAKLCAWTSRVQSACTVTQCSRTSRILLLIKGAHTIRAQYTKNDHVTALGPKYSRSSILEPFSNAVLSVELEVLIANRPSD